MSVWRRERRRDDDRAPGPCSARAMSSSHAPITGSISPRSTIRSFADLLVIGVQMVGLRRGGHACRACVCPPRHRARTSRLHAVCVITTTASAVDDRRCVENGDVDMAMRFRGPLAGLRRTGSGTVDHRAGRALARRHGIADGVLYFDGGSPPATMRAASPRSLTRKKPLRHLGNSRRVSRAVLPDPFAPR